MQEFATLAHLLRHCTGCARQLITGRLHTCAKSRRTLALYTYVHLCIKCTLASTTESFQSDEERAATNRDAGRN